MSVIFRFSLKTPREQPNTTVLSDSPRQGWCLNGGRHDQGQQGTVLLIHGLTGTPQEMKGIGTLLHRQGYTVTCPWLARHGEPIDILRQTTWEECYHSVRSMFLTLQQLQTPQPIFAGGLSMGALLALELAAEFPEQIRGVSCLSPTLFYDGWNMPWMRHFLPLAYATPLKHWAYFKEEPPYGIKNEAVRQRIHRYYEGADLHDVQQVAQYGYPYFPVSLLYQLHRLVRYVEKRLNRITTPVQLIQATEDDMTSPRNAQYLYDRLGSSVKELILLTNSYHIITVDQERDTVAQKMATFFARFNRRLAT